MKLNIHQKEWIEIIDSLERQLSIPSTKQPIYFSEFQKEIVFVREDLIHPVISGNKWRKAKYHLLNYGNNQYSGISSLGGVYSNHLHALAYICFKLNIPCTLFIYGWHGEQNSATLNDCLNWNAHLVKISRKEGDDLRIKGNSSGVYQKHSSYYWIPEGGGGELGELGIKELVNELPEQCDKFNNLMVCPCGTGTTIQGILNHTNNCLIATLQVVKMANYPWVPNERILFLNTDKTSSFAKKDNELLRFIIDIQEKYSVLLDTVYTGPLLLALFHQMSRFKEMDIFFIHTGGLQSNRI